MQEEKKETLDKEKKLEKAKKRIELINKWRLVFMFIAIVLLVLIFWGGKAWEDVQWFINIRQKLYNFLWYDIVLLVISTFAKLFSAMRYNNIVRKL